jgi:RNA polymerase sigma-70 factor (ECF subfamily)
MDPIRLLERCRAGDELAWEALVSAYQGRICSLAYHYTGSEEEALDVAQEIFVKVWKQLGSCQEPERFLAWLMQIGRNACLDHLRRRKARPPAQDLAAEDLVHLPDHGSRPDDDYEQDRRRRLLEAGLKQLSPINREVIVLKDIQGLSLEDIATMLDLPIGTVKSRTSRARLELGKAVLTLTGGLEATS